MISFRGRAGARPQSARPRRPPDFLSRRAQLRILTLFAALALVTVLMHEARDPGNWRWIWALDRTADQKRPDPTGAKPGKNRAAGTSALSHGGDGPSKDVVHAAASDAEPPGGSLHRLQRDGWNMVRKRLAPPDRRLLQQVLYDTRHGVSLAPREQAAWFTLVELIDKNWRLYATQFLATTDGVSSPLTAARKRACRVAMQRCLDSIQELRPALRAAVAPKQMIPAQHRQLAQLQTLFDEIAWRQVQDNTPTWRSAEYDAWYRVWERLEENPTAARPATVPAVTRRQLFSQPQAYRGRVVKLNGTVRSAYRADAAPNPLHIKYYYVLSIYLRPTDPSAVRVYCRALPNGFPNIPSGNTPQLVRLNETITVTGYFFKRAVCLTTTGPQLTPIVLGSITGWTPRPLDQGGPAGPAPRDLVILCCGAALFAVLFAYWVYRHTNRLTKVRRGFER